MILRVYSYENILFPTYLQGVPPETSLNLDTRRLVSVECACGVCKRNKKDYMCNHDSKDSNGKSCCKCVDTTPKCFPATTEVFLDNGKLVKMSELQVGDRVLTGMNSVSVSELQIGKRVLTGGKSITMSEL